MRAKSPDISIPWSHYVAKPQVNNPLHGVTLEKIVTTLVEWYGWEKLGKWIKIKCFSSNPSVKSSLKFLRKTPWARTKVENLYLVTLKKKQKQQ